MIIIILNILRWPCMALLFPKKKIGSITMVTCPPSTTPAPDYDPAPTHNSVYPFLSHNTMCSTPTHNMSSSSPPPVMTQSTPYPSTIQSTLPSKATQPTSPITAYSTHPSNIPSRCNSSTSSNDDDTGASKCYFVLLMHNLLGTLFL